MDYWRTFHSWAVIVSVILLAGSFAYGADRKSENWMASGKMALADGLYPEASRYFENVIDRAKDPVFRNQARLLLARALYEAGERDEVLALIQENPDTPETPDVLAGQAYWSARVALDQHRTAEALDIITALEVPIDSTWAVPLHFLKVEGLKKNKEWNSIIETTLAFDQEPLSPDISAANRLERAIALEQNGDIQDAALAYEEVISTHPEHPVSAEAAMRLAKLRKEHEELEGAVDALYQRVAQEASFPFPVRERALFTWVLSLKESGEYSKALKLIQDPDTPPAKDSAQWLALEAELQASLGDLETAKATIRKAVEKALTPDEGSALLLAYGDHLLELENYDDALDKFQLHLELFTLEEDRSLALLGKAWALYGLGQYKEAASFFEQALPSLPREHLSEEALAKVGDAYFKSDQFQQAADAYQRFVTTYPESALIGNTTLQYAETLIRLNRIDEAILTLEAFKQDAAKPGHRRLAERRVAELYEQQGKLEDALKGFERILTESEGPDSAAAWVGRGRIYYQQGKFYEALADFEHVGGAFPETRHAEQALAFSVWCRYLLQQDEEALQLARDFIQNYQDSPQAPQIQFWLAEYRFNRGEFEQAEPAFIQLTEDYPDHDLADDALFWAGRSEFEQSSYSNAVIHFSQLLQDYPESSKAPEAQFAKGDALSRLGRFNAAVEAFKMLIQNVPEHYLVDDAYGRLGDCHFTLGADDPNQYQLSRDAYAMVLNRANASADKQVQALYKIGRCYQKMEDIPQAKRYYIDAVYTYEQAVGSGTMMSPIWFSRAAFAAADILLAEDRLEEAAKLYKRVVAAGVPASSDARSRLNKMRVDFLRMF